MADNLNLNQKANEYSFVSTQIEWHKKGQLVKEAMNSEEAINLSHLDYEVKKTPVLASIGNNTVEVEGKFVTYRNDTGETLGVIGSRYEIVQNKDAFVFFDSIVGQGQAIFQTAGALGKGERIFVTAKMPNFIRINNTNDITENYVILTSSHDGTGSIICGITSIRVCCANTLRMCLENLVNKVSIRHTKNAERNLAEAHKLLGIVNEYNEKANEALNHLALKPISDSQVMELVEKLFKNNKEEESTRIKNIREEVLNSYYTGIGQDKILGTAYGFLQGVTHYTNHVKKYKNDDIKFENLLMDGTSSKINQSALELVMAL